MHKISGFFLYICRGNGARTKNSKIMARQNGVIQYRGKLGMTVGMRNGFGGQQNFSREYIDTINNPQTDLQIALRVRMLPAVLFRRQLSNVISRAWQGVDFGGPSIRMFMKYALREPLGNVPQLLKDSTIPIPGAYLISKGSLKEIQTTFDEENSKFVTTLPADASGNINDISQAIIEQAGFHEGDQVTFVFAITGGVGNEDPLYVDYAICSFIIDTTDNRQIGEIQPTGVELTTSNGVFEFNDDGLRVIGAACVISRNGNTTPLRSKATFAIAKTRMPGYFSETLKADVKASYVRSSRSRSSNWEYDDEVQGGGAREQADGTYTLTGLTGNLASLNGQPAKVKRYVDNGNLSAVYARADGDDRLVVGTDNNPYSVEDPQTHLITWLEVSQVAAFSGLPLILVD